MSDLTFNSSVLDEIYSLLSGIDEDLRQLEADSKHYERAGVYVTEHIRDAVEFLADAGYENRLGISATEVWKFRRIKGTIRIDVLRQVGERAKRLLKEYEGEIFRELSSRQRTEITEPNESTSRTRDPPTSINAEKWVALSRASNADLVTEISVLLNQAILLARNVNLPPEQRALSSLERAQLVALLETTLALLKAPLIETGLLAKLKSAAQKGAANAAEKKVELALGYGLGKLAEVVAMLLSNLS